MTDQRKAGERPEPSEKRPSPSELARYGRRQPTATNPQSALTAMLRQRVRVSLSSEMRWMSGYEALASALRHRSIRGDGRAAVLLASLAKYAGVADESSRILQTNIAPQTLEERELATAFAKRVIEQLAKYRVRRHPRKRVP
jgi:hypothetical protein